MISLDRIYCGRNVLVTGGFGFVGAQVARRLLDCGARVWVLDRDTDIIRPSLINCAVQGLRARIRVVRGDITNRNFMADLIAEHEFSYIFNCAAHAAVIEKAVDDPMATVLTNTIGVVGLLDAIRESGCYPQAVFHASTDKVYGELTGSEYEEEQTPLRAIGVYDSSKLAAELMARTYHEVFGIPIVTLRMCNLFGSYDFNDGYRLVPKSMSSIFTGEAPHLYVDSLDHHREYLHIDDAVEIILEVTARPACHGEAFNLMGCAYLSTCEAMERIVEAAARVMEARNPKLANDIRLRRYSVVDRRSAGNKVISLKKQRLNAEKLKAVISYRPRLTFEEGLAKTAEYYRYYYQDMLATA